MIARPQQRHSDVIPYERQCPTREETKTTVGAGRIALGRIEDFASFSGTFLLRQLISGVVAIPISAATPFCGSDATRTRLKSVKLDCAQR